MGGDLVPFIILLSILLLSSPVIGDNHKGETLYRWDNPSGDGYVWKGFGDKETHPVYKGDVENGKPNGLGVIIYTDGDKYVGSWKDGKKNGQGTYTFISGSRYVGEWKDGRKHGQGTYTFPDGEEYVGEWKDGIRNGQGTYTFSDVGKDVGEYKDGILWNGTSYDKDGNILGKFVNGKKIKQ